MAMHEPGLFHMDIKVHSRSQGADISKLMAYRGGCSMVSPRTGRRHTYSRKKEVAYSAVCLPSEAPLDLNDRRVLTQAIDAAEYRINSQLVREVEVALPRDLSFDQQIRLLHHFVERAFTSKGMIASFDVHNKSGNPHCHILLSLRSVTPDGFGAKVREWNEHSLAESWRKRWARSCNAALRLAGSVTRLDHRSYARRGLDIIKPTKHLGTRREGNAEKWDALAEENELILGRREIRDARALVRDLQLALERNADELLTASMQSARDAMANDRRRCDAGATRKTKRATKKIGVTVKTGVTGIGST